MLERARRRKDSLENPSYLSHFHFKEAPFAQNHTSRFFYADPDRDQVLNMLQHLTQYSEELLLVVGEPGVGKTSLFEQFISRAEDDWRVCRVDGATQGDPAKLFVHIAEGFGFDSARHANNPLAAFTSHLGALRPHKLPVLVIDDAHLLKEDALEIALRLSTLEGEHGKLVRPVLFAEPEFAKALQDKRFAALTTHRLELTPFDEAYTELYLSHRLSAAGFDGENPFQPKLLKKIYKQSEGYPLRVNQAAHEALLEQLSLARPSGLLAALRSPRLPYALGGLALAVVAALGIAYQDDINAFFEPPSASVEPLALATPATALPANPPAAPLDIADDAESVELLAPAVVEPDVQEASGPDLALEPESAMVSEDFSAAPESEEPLETPAFVADSADTPVVEPPAVQPAVMEDANMPGGDAEPAAPVPPMVEALPPLATEPEAEAPGEGVAEALPPRISAVSPNPVTASARQQTLRLQGEGFTPQSRIRVKWRGGDKLLPGDRVLRNDDGSLSVRLTTGMIQDHWMIRVSNPDGQVSEPVHFEVVLPAEATVAKVAAPAKGELGGAEWVARQPASNYTLQLLAAREKATVDSLLARGPLPEPAALLVGRRDGQPLYLLLQGSYATREAAEQAMRGFPAGLAALSPWVRRFDEVPLQRFPADFGLKDVAWLWARDPRHFTMQLFSLTSRSAVEGFVREHDLPSPTAYYVVRKEGRDWHVLVTGDFPDRDTAEAAAAKLPKALGHPWLRPFADVHMTLTEHGHAAQ